MATSNESMCITTSESSYTRMIQNFLLVWLDENIDEINDEGCHNSIINLRQVVNTINTFTNSDECVDFITCINEDKIFFIVSGALSQIIVPVVESIHNVSCVYIFCENKNQHEQSVKQWLKVKGVFTDISSVCEALKRAAHECDQDLISISLVKPTNEVVKIDLDELDQSFMYTQILKEILLTIDFEEIHINQFLDCCRKQFVGNTSQLQNVNKLQNEYHSHQPIWWYTPDCFLYSMLNKALRTMEVNLIIQMGFFVQDLHQHIARLHFEQYGGHHHRNTFTVFRGQGLSQTDFDQLMKTKGGLMSFNNFLSTSLDQAISFAFADSNQSNPDLIGVLFKITVNTSITSTPFANVIDVSYYQQEEEILFSMHTVFRIEQVDQIDGNDRLWQVDLTLTSDNDPQLHALTERIRKETFPNQKGWYRLGAVLIKLGLFNKAEDLYNILLQQAINELEQGSLYHYLGLTKYGQGKYTEAITFYEKSEEISQKILSPTDANFIASYNNIGTVYTDLGKYKKALSYYQKALEIAEKAVSPNHPLLATTYANIGSVYDKVGEYSKALSSHEKALEICKKTLPSNHPDLAIVYSNIGSVFTKVDEYSQALSNYKKSLEIFQKTLPPNHPSLATSNTNIGTMYYKMDEYSKALSHYEKGHEICQNALPPNHPDLAISYDNIGSVYNTMGEHPKGLFFCVKALEIKQKALPPNHPGVAISYDNIGEVYYAMGEYSKALSYYNKSFEIRQKILPSNHRDLADSYNNIGFVYTKMREYSKAVLYYEKAFEIEQKILPPNHPNFAFSYSKIGCMCDKMGEYSKALSSHEKSFEIRQKTLPPNHSLLGDSYYFIAWAYRHMGKYSQALSYYRRALDIWQRSLPPNHADLEDIRKCIELVKMKL